ncbi:MAG TPA: hypothetical protein VJV74_05635, partial [Terriglobia bacterium]|nr:hypothetical protein [Terriglobia bacterium]
MNLASIEQLLPAPLHYPLASLLAHSPDPDAALNLLERYITKAPRETLSDLAAYPTALTYLIAIFGYSGYLAETFLAEPGLPLQFARDRNFSKLKSKEDLMQDYARFATAAPDPWLSAQLGRFKQRTYLRLVLKDVLGMSTLAETTLELSELADVLLTNALAYCDQELRKRYGEPQYRDAQGRIARSQFSIVSLGKLGGNELNYSSDIDLLFLYSNNGETSGGSEPDSVISNKEYFVRLANAVTRSITQNTPHGPVFRVDVRLRPEGDMGDMTISLRSALEYYEHRARDWELQMLIKARHSAGDEKLTREFLRGVEPRIYGCAADFAAIETILRSRERISKKLRAGRAESIDVKLHPGGIRDVEFLTQCLQRLHGGHDPWVRSGGTLLALRKLNDKGYLRDKDYAALITAYEFLRKAEHLIQLDRGQQTHRLPADADAVDRLARRMGIDHSSSEPGRELLAGAAPRPGVRLMALLEETFTGVREIYQNVIHPRAAPSQREEYSLRPPAALLPDQAGASFEAAKHFLDAHSPDLAARIEAMRLPARAQRNVGMFLAKLLSSTSSFDIARRDPEKLVRALETIAASDYLAGLLAHHPEDLAALESAPSASPPEQLEMYLGNLAENQPAGGRAVEPAFEWILESGRDLREHMAFLRHHFRAQKLALAWRDVTHDGPVFSALWSWSRLASQSIATALGIALQGLEGASRSLSSRDPAELPFAVLGLGRLGVHEFDLGSDADLMFVAATGVTEHEIERWARLAEKLIEVVSSYTGDGTLFAIDTRLRPLGQEGELVVTEEALVRYARDQAQVWEAMAYLKVLPVAGNIAFGERAAARLAQTLLDRFSHYPKLEEELLQMRRRLERELASARTQLKAAPGGYYDVDYTLACLQLRNRAPVPPGSNTLERIDTLRSAGLLEDEDARMLASG